MSRALIMQFTIPGTLPGLNDYIAAINSNRHSGNAVKGRWTHTVACLAKQARQSDVGFLLLPVWIECTFYEPNRRRDKDNVGSFAQKVLQDGLVEAEILDNDNWRYVDGYTHKFALDKENPRIEVKIYSKEGFRNVE